MEARVKNHIMMRMDKASDQFSGFEFDPAFDALRTGDSGTI
jgi:hypothetical protein